jgi:adenylate cyclase
VPVVIGGVAALWLLGATAFGAGFWVPVAAPALGWVSAMGVTLAWTASLERAQRNLLMQLFSSYVSPEVADEIWRHRDQLLPGGRLRAQHLMATVMFVDVKGYSAQAEKMSPEQLMTWINEFMEPMAHLVGAYHGVVDDYFGDGIKANFGVPFPSTNDDAVRDDARRAARCALAMERALHELNLAHRARELPTIAMRIGLHTGPVVAGILGNEVKLKYTTVGDVPVTAQRLESFSDVDHDFAAEPVRILVSSATADLLGDEFELSYLGEFTLKGRSEPVSIHSVKQFTARGPAPGQA